MEPGPQRLTLAQYQEALGALSFGKRLPTSVYVYRSENCDLGARLQTLVEQAIMVFGIGAEFNVIKFRLDELKISFLSHPDFFDDAHPMLHTAVTVDLVSGKAKRMDYSKNPNPPILHRKETFLPEDHALWGEFRALTEAEEAAGLYENTTTIGFKLNWERLLGSKGLMIRGHTLAKSLVAGHAKKLEAVPFVERHKTAMTRYELSKPVKSLLEYGVLKTGDTFFDYGCGQGADVRGLQGLGYTAEGWDPVFRPKVLKRSADVVNLGYVLNVIEDPAERLEALVDAFQHAHRILVVAALINETVETERSARFRDGVLTRRNTFQKFFEQQ